MAPPTISKTFTSFKTVLRIFNEKLLLSNKIEERQGKSERAYPIKKVVYQKKSSRKEGGKIALGPITSKERDIVN